MAPSRVLSPNDVVRATRLRQANAVTRAGPQTSLTDVSSTRRLSGLDERCLDLDPQRLENLFEVIRLELQPNDTGNVRESLYAALGK